MAVAYHRAGLPLVGAIISLWSSGCVETGAVNEVKEELLSPDGKSKVVLFSRGSGATTGFNTQATVLSRGEPLPDDGGNAFIVDKGEAKVTWKSDGGILVIFDHEVRIFKKESSVRGVAIEYRESER